MEKKLITCGKCSSYSRGLMRCVHGKVNPRTKKATRGAMEFGGVSYICAYNPWKEAIIDELLKERR